LVETWRKRLGDSSKSESIRRGDMSMNGTAIANQRYTMIADILIAIFSVLLVGSAVYATPSF